MTIERMERGLDILAQIMVQAGDEGRLYLPLYVRLEAELAQMRAAGDAMTRVQARAALLRQSEAGGSKLG